MTSSSARIPEAWFIALPARVPAAALAVCYALLDDDERRRAAAFLVEPAREQYVVAHALLRTLLSDAVPAFPPHAWRFGRGLHGKPFVAGMEVPPPAAPAFSLSHTAGLVAAAIAHAGEIGIDVEGNDRPVAVNDFKACLSDVEQRELAGLTLNDQRRRFFDIWTAKEAVVKARGTGLTDGLRRLTIVDAGTDPTLLEETDAAQGHRLLLQRLDVSPGHAAAIAMEDDRAPVVRVMTLDEWVGVAQAR